MKKSKIAKWIAGAGASLAFAATLLISSMGGGILGLNGEDNGSSEVITASAAGMNYEAYSGDDFSRFKNGAIYSYTHPTKAKDYHDAFMKGNTPTDSDVKDVTVNTDANRGTEANPYVITSVAEWNALAAKATSYTAATVQNKYFVLGCDIDAGSISNALNPIPAFGGIFCGNGYMISNITMNTPSATNNGRGLFNSASGATISDLRIDMNMTATGAASYQGGLVGYVAGATNILNCQADVVWNQTGGTSGNFGGLIGTTAGVQVLLYRCSADFNFTMTTNNNSYYAGLIGATVGAVQLNVFDSLAKTVADQGTTSQSKFSGGVVGVFRESSNAVIHIENVIVDFDTKAEAVTWGAAVAHVEASSYYPKTLVMTNVWASGTDTVSGTTTCRYLINGGVVSNNHQGNIRKGATFTNAHCAVGCERKVGSGFDGVEDRTNTSSAYYAETITGSSQADAEAKLWADAKADTHLPEDIWTDKSLIGTGFGTNSPIINTMKVQVTYHNYKLNSSGADISTKYAVTDESLLTVSKGAPLYIPDESEILANRTFCGWTADNTDSSAPFKTMIAGLRGEVKLYAVWEIVTASASINATAATGSTMTGNATDGYTAGYRKGGGISLTPALTAANMDNPQITYQWKNEDGTDVKAEDGGKNKSLKIENVRQSGSYTVTLNFYSKSEPLFYGEVKAENVTPANVTIEPAKLNYFDVTFDAVKRPYSGAPYDRAVPSAIVKNTDGIIVTGTTSWASDVGKFNNVIDNADNIDQVNGKETKKIKFIPAEEYNGNYGEAVYFDATFKIEYLQFIFSIPRLDDLELTVDLEYWQYYTYNNVVDLFEEVFEPYLGTLAGDSPAFMVNGQKVKINDYRNLGSTAYASIEQSYTIEVAFVPQSYTVKFDARNEGNNTYDDMTIGHGIRVPKPTNPEYGSLMFLGWFYEHTDGEGNKTDVAWNFDSDRITRDLNLFAKWLEADTLIELIVTPSPLAKFVAKQPLDPSMVTVKAVFGTDEDPTFRQEAVLSSDQYIITYEDGASVLHAKAGNETTAVTFTYDFKDDQSASKTLNVRVEKIKVDTSVLRNKYFKDTAVVVTGGPQTMKPIDPSIISSTIPELAGCTVAYKYYNSQEKEITDLNDVKSVGVYYVRAYFEPTDTDYDAPHIQARFQIVNEKIKLNVDWGEIEFEYNGKVQVPEPKFTRAEGADAGEPINASYHLLDINGKSIDDEDHAYDLEAIKAGSNYRVEIYLEDLAYELADSAYTSFAIKPATLKAPTQEKHFAYNGTVYDLNSLSPSDYERYFAGFNPLIMEIQRGGTGKDASRYTATVVLRDPDSARFEDGSDSATMTWFIDKAKLTVDWNSYEFYANNGIQIPQAIIFYEFYGDDADMVDYNKDIEYSGDINAMAAGEYTITVIIKPEAAWIKNYELDNSKTCSFVILPKAGMEIITIVWDTNTLFEYNGNVQRPTFKVYNKVGADITSEVPTSEFRYNDEAQSSKFAGDYTATLTTRPGSNYFITGDASCIYTITTNEKGEGNAPNGPGNNPGGNTLSGLPLWQLIVGGVSALLFVFCTLKTFGEYGKTKAAKREAKELAAQSYAVNYGFVPLPLLAMGAGVKFLGLEETPWTIIALVAVGLFLISAVALFIMSKKRKAAELVVKREQARIAEEKEYAREEEQRLRDEQVRQEMREEQARRDNEMKMMFAAMQQGGYGQPMYDDSHIQNLIASTVSALLPAMQQQMALPPAQDPNAYAQPNYGAPSSGISAEAQNEIDRLHAQMAQQQELLNQLLQNQQAQQAAYDYEEEPVDDISWLGESEEVVSLEESYGALSDEEKRAYYDIGSYIMSKPQISQNDGRYAVLFKYRGRTLFKLAIKDGAPVLYYPLNGGRGEVSIADSASLETAKSMIDRSVSMIDSQLN